MELLIYPLAEHLLPAPVAAIGLKFLNIIVYRSDTRPCTISGSAATGKRCMKIRIARKPLRALRGV